ncbi:MAG: radical SAM protein [Thermodesulfobacteriota bacterium]
MKKTPLNAVVADVRGNIFELEGYQAVGMSGEAFSLLTPDQTVPTPFGTEFMYLPQRKPILYNLEKKELEILSQNPYAPGEPIFPVAAFNSPGYVVSHLCAYQEENNAKPLPLFSYGAVGWKKGRFRSSAILVDRERRQDLRKMRITDVRAQVKKLRKQLRGNRLREHLEICALVYGCPAGKNFFLGRYEAPLPTSRTCNAGCLGCISLQKEKTIPCTQNRIAFIPSSDEIAEIALFHIHRARNPVVSFGQGCEGEPLLAAHVIEPAIKIIRKKTRRGTINLNTNAGRPKILKQLLEAGLDSIRVSINSFQEKYYNAYFRPRSYRFGDVIKSIESALSAKKFVSINYLNSPGFTDSSREVKALFQFLTSYPIHYIQWRNLNYDPIRYRKTVWKDFHPGETMGMKALLEHIQDSFPHIRYGYFNPPKEKFRRFPGFLNPYFSPQPDGKPLK